MVSPVQWSPGTPNPGSLPLSMGTQAGAEERPEWQEAPHGEAPGGLAPEGRSAFAGEAAALPSLHMA